MKKLIFVLYFCLAVILLTGLHSCTSDEKVKKVDKVTYDTGNVKDILKKMDNAMLSLERYKYKEEYKNNISGYDDITEAEVDMKNGRLHITSERNIRFDYECYFFKEKNKMYIKTSDSNQWKWEDKDDIIGYNHFYGSEGSTEEQLDLKDSDFSQMSVKKDKGELILELNYTVADAGKTRIYFKLDGDSLLLKEFQASNNAGSGKTTYSDYNGNFIIDTPVESEN